MKKYINPVIEWEKEISEWDEIGWNEELKKINNIKTKQDIVNYYLIDRGWYYQTDLMVELLHFIATLD